MLKIEIKDPTIRIRPSIQLVDYLKTLKREPKIPKNIQQLIGKKTSVFDENIDFITNLNKNESELFQKVLKAPIEREENSTEPQENGSKVETPLLESYDLKWLLTVLQKRREDDPKTPYLHELMQGSDVILPKNEYQERNPELEARCQRLRREQEQRMYDQMTKNVDNVRRPQPDESIGAQSKGKI